MQRYPMVPISWVQVGFGDMEWGRAGVLGRGAGLWVGGEERGVWL